MVELNGLTRWSSSYRHMVSHEIDASYHRWIILDNMKMLEVKRL